MSDSSPESSDNEAVEGMPFRMYDITVGDLIFEDSSFARGAFGRMVKADYFGVTVCVKILKKQRKKELAKFVQREMAALKTLSHPNLVQFIGLTEKGNEICLVTEYISGGTLRKLLKDTTIAIPWHIRVQIAVDIASAMTYLHSRKIMHRDLKSKNLLVGDNWKIKICDFGFARSVHDKKKAAALTFCGTEEYMAPEVIFGMEYDERAEVYSYGLLLCEIIVRRKVEETVPRTSNTNYGLDHQEFTNHVPRDCPVELLQLAYLCTEFEPKNRPEFREITQILREIKQNVAASPMMTRAPPPHTQAPAPVYNPPPPVYNPPPPVHSPPPPAPTPAPVYNPPPPIYSPPPPAHASVPPPQQPLPPPPMLLEDDLYRDDELLPSVEKPIEKQIQNGDPRATKPSTSPPLPLRHPAPVPFRRSPSAPIPMPVPAKGAKTNAKEAPRAPAKGAAREGPGPSKLKPATPAPPTPSKPNAVTAKNTAARNAVEEILAKPPAPLTRTSSSTFPTPKPSGVTSPSTSPPNSSTNRGKPPATAPVPSRALPPQVPKSSPSPTPPKFASSPSNSPSPSPTPPKGGIALPKVPATVPPPTSSSSPRSLPPRDRPSSPLAKPAPPGRAGRPALPNEIVDKKRILI